MRVTDNYVLFFRHTIFGNWVHVPSGIMLPLENNRTVSLPTSEHVFMALKAQYFKDYETLEKIIFEPNAKVAKRLGRQVKGFSEEAWEKYREEAMKTAISLRAVYDKKFKAELLRPDYDGKTFVECNPNDYIWGCGLEEDDFTEDQPWKGLNLLGKLLTDLRNYLKNG